MRISRVWKIAKHLRWALGGLMPLFLFLLPIAPVSVLSTGKTADLSGQTQWQYGWDTFSGPMDFANSNVLWNQEGLSLQLTYNLVGALPNTQFTLGIALLFGSQSQCVSTFGQIALGPCLDVSRQGVTSWEDDTNGVSPSGVGMVTTDASGDGSFQVLISGIDPGAYDIEFYAADDSGINFQSPGPFGTGLSLTFATATVVQSAYAPSASTTSLSATFPSDVTAGDVVIVGCQAGSLGGASTSISASDSQGNAYTTNVVSSSIRSDDSFFDAILSAPVASTGSDTVTCSSSTTATMKLQILEVAGIVTAGVSTGSGSSNSASSSMSTSPVGFASGALLYAIGNDAGAGSCSPGTGFTGQALPGGDTETEYSTSAASSSTTFTMGCATTGGAYAEAGAAFPTPSWPAMTTVNPGSESYFDAVSCTSPSFCVAGGSTNGVYGGTLAEEWNGSTWSTMTTPTESSPFYGVSCTSPSFCVAVGSIYGDSTLAEQWNGTSWSTMVTTDPNIYNVLYGVSCTSPSFCVAVGDYNDGANPQSLAEQWNGSTWSTMAAVSLPIGYDTLRSVSCTSTTSCVAVGSYAYGYSGAQYATLAEEWNGSTWSLLTTVDPSQDDGFSGVSCTSSSICIAVGSLTGTPPATAATLAEEWNGSTWSLLTSVDPSQDDGFQGVSCTSSSFCIAVGAYTTAETSPTMAELWDGATWSMMTTSNPGTNESLNADSCPLPAQCVAVGQYVDSTGNTDTLAESFTSPILVTVSGSQTYGSSSPIFSDSASPPAGVTIAGTPTCGTVNDGTPSSPGLAAGDYTIDGASCSGLSASDPNYILEYAGAANGFVVSAASTTTTVASSSSPSVAGQPVTYTARVSVASPGAGTPTGTVSFEGDGGALCTVPSVLSGSGIASCTTTYSGVTTDSVTATYSGDSNFSGSSSSPLSHQVSEAATTTTVAVSSSSAVTGQPVTYTATVSVQTPGAGAPTGSVSFTGKGGTPCSNVPLTGSGPYTAGCVVTYTAAGTDSVTATYSGNSNYATSTSSPAVSEQITQATTTMMLTSSANPGEPGQAVTFTATVSPAAPSVSTPAGDVTFAFVQPDGAAPLECTGGNSQALVAGAATCMVAAGGLELPNSPLEVTASYPGDPEDGASSASPLIQTVGGGSSTTTVTSTVSPSSGGGSVKFEATVAAVAPATGAPQGSVTFLLRNAAGQTIPCKAGDTASIKASGLAKCAISEATLYASGSPYTVIATYDGSGAFGPSTSAPFTQTVGLAAVSVTLSSSSKKVAPGGAVTLTATVTPVVANGPAPTGSVTFTLTEPGSTTIACSGGNTQSISGTTATCQIPTGVLPATGAKYKLAVQASYSGDDNYATGLATFTQKVS